jgi:hypothetical protein
VSPKQKGVFGKNAVAINVSQMLHYHIILKWCLTPDREKKSRSFDHFSLDKNRWFFLTSIFWNEDV